MHSNKMSVNKRRPIEIEPEPKLVEFKCLCTEDQKVVLQTVLNSLPKIEANAKYQEKH